MNETFCPVHPIVQVGHTWVNKVCIILHLGEEKHKYGKQRMWGAIGWGTMSILSGLCVDWFSKGEENKNYAPGFIIAILCTVLDIYVLSKIKVSTLCLPVNSL